MSGIDITIWRWISANFDMYGYRKIKIRRVMREISKIKSRRVMGRSRRRKKARRGKKGLTDVLRLNVGVNKVTFIMKVLETKKNLFCDDLDERTWHALLLISVYECEEVFAKRFKHNTDVRCFGSLIRERIEEGNDVRSARVCGGEGGHTRK